MAEVGACLAGARLRLRSPAGVCEHPRMLGFAFAYPGRGVRVCEGLGPVAGERGFGLINWGDCGLDWWVTSAEVET
ncbi:hypothetical protein GCM10010177_39260 [Actinomadura citrea]|nr:hypothetical protein GCM10010177_39260 [Actinomadura citrea]